MADTQVVRVPDIGDFQDVEVIELLVAPGDVVKVEQPLLTLESDKATMDVPSSHSGTVIEVLVQVGTRVSQGDSIVSLAVPQGDGEELPDGQEESRSGARETGAGTHETRDGSGETETATPSSVPGKADQGVEKASVSKAPANVAAQPPTLGATSNVPYASPGVRRYARELGADLTQVTGTGRKGRITREDVQGWVKARLSATPGGMTGAGIPAMPDEDFAQYGDVEEVELTKIRRVGAANLHRAWLHVPHVTHHDEADVTDMEEFWKSHASRAKEEGIKLTPLAFIAKACVTALREFPDFNSSLGPGGTSIIRKLYYRFGIAVDTPQGLVVPVVRDVDRKGVWELAREVTELGQRARARKLTLDDLQGATFSLSNLGGLGGTAFTPIVNAPQVAILGISRTQTKPHWQGDRFVPRRMLPLSLSYDHRVIDGAAGARFTRRVAELLSDIRQLLF